MINVKYKEKTSLIREIENLLVKKILARRNVENSKYRSVKVVFAHDWIGANIFLNGVYEEYEINVVREVCDFLFGTSAVVDVIDIGANIGNHAIQFSRYFNAVYTFEPNPKTYELLLFNTNKIANIKNKCVGLGSSNEIKILYEDETNYGASSMIRKGETKSGMNIQVRVLDDYFSEFNNIGLIKIDVEGMESEVLSGAENTIKFYRPVIAFEQHISDFDSIQKSSKTITLLEGWGYVMHWFDEPTTYTIRGLGIFARLFDIIINGGIKKKLVASNNVPVKSHSIIIAVPRERLSL